MTPFHEHVLVCGISTRAVAESAAKAGFRVTALDGYADLDQHPSVRALSVSRDFAAPPTAAALARAARTVECDAVAYLSPFENHPYAVARLAAGRALWGNPPDVLRRVRDPHLVAGALRRHGFAVPNLSNAPNVPNVPNVRLVRWFAKPLRSGGGQRIRPWRGGPVPRGSYLQQRIDGTPGSVVFIAAGGRALPLAVTRQLIGDAAFGATGYRYCGSVVAAAPQALFDDGDAVVSAAHRLAQVVAAEFGLVGLNGIDFVARDGVPYPIEVNPRWSSSMEVVEWLTGESLFAAHAAACARGELPREIPVVRGVDVVGKAIVFARRDVVIGDTRAWLDERTVRDVPHPGERISAGQPVCTVLATAENVSGCYAALETRAARVYRELEGC